MKRSRCLALRSVYVCFRLFFHISSSARMLGVHVYIIHISACYRCALPRVTDVRDLCGLFACRVFAVNRPERRTEIHLKSTLSESTSTNRTYAFDHSVPQCGDAIKICLSFFINGTLHHTLSLWRLMLCRPCKSFERACYYSFVRTGGDSMLRVNMCAFRLSRAMWRLWRLWHVPTITAGLAGLPYAPRNTHV